MKRRIYIYPHVADRQQLNEVVARLAWYMRPYLGAIDGIHIALSDASWLNDVALPPHLDPAITALLPALRAHIAPHHPEALTQRIAEADPKNDVLLVIDTDAEAAAPQPVRDAIDAFRRHGGFYRVDAQKTRQEGSFYLWCGLNKFRDARALGDHYQTRMRAMLSEIGQQQNAYVFGTGPSLSDYLDGHDFSDGLCIVANSIVKDKSALERLKPRIICAADPIYHAGCSSYAGAFREALVEALQQTGAWFVCPLRDAGIYEAFLPADLAARMVCLPFDAKKDIPVDLSSTFHLHPFPNVLTLMLLPLAATLAARIRIVGCDGRRLLDDSFFWSHDRKVQFNDQMAEIQAAHPGFFAIDYNDYFLDHCHDVEKVLARLEESGRAVFTETPSLIPALRSRQYEPAPPPPALQTFIMLDPDAKDDWGHFLAYDKRVAEAAAAQGMRVALLCREELPPRFQPEHVSLFVPVFTIHSWSVGNKFPPQRETALRFATELSEGLRRVEAEVPEGDICLFFYVGSLEAAEMLEFLLIEHPRLHAVVNLFWSYGFDQQDPAYRARWLPVARRMARNPRLHLTHSTGQISQEFARDWGLELPVLQHPSTTFSDAEALRLAAMPLERAPASRLRVVFPGGARAEKGFLLSLDAAARLRGSAGLDLALRARLDKVSGPRLQRAFEAFDPRGIEIIDQDLSDDQFIDMLRDADIVVIPYHHEAFRRRTSGILVDAMLLGKPVVVLRDTWLADVVEAEGLGVCVAPSADGIVEGIEQIAAHYARFVACIEVARGRYLETNAWSVLARGVRGLADGTIRPVPRENTALAAMSPQQTASRVAVLRHAAALLLHPDDPPEDDAALRQALAMLPDDDGARVHLARVQAYLARKNRPDATAPLAAQTPQAGT